MRKTFFISFLVILFSLISIGCGKEKTEPVKESRTSVASNLTNTSETVLSSSASLTTNQTTIPTLFIHGYGGAEGSFNGMLSRFEFDNFGNKVLTVTVQPNGTVSDTGTWGDQLDNPLIQVLFADNKSSELNQTEWIKAVLNYLNQTYQIEEVNLVGHSMGGVSSFRHLITYGNDDSLPMVNKFIAIGAPFNNFVSGNEEQTIDALIQNGPIVLSERYSDYAASIQYYPKTTKMLNIVGDLEDGSEGDGTVPIRSSLAIGYLMQTNEFEYQDEIIAGSQAHHSQLHENTQVDELVANFLWDSP
ncbi:alpha/beta hydrolase [Desemzia sp. RIT804]|uniref:alpha/beta hydrolase n=1 Tax=Desemzia sp. RIT 804 TaxID=2810209 RepID=UPI0019509DAA|nr:alpha/beta hydrolase [Desemzia sp. RIT 804]MBM6613698.1 alpha/beta hydrolase [Desemzia sp. RIT 804]